MNRTTLRNPNTNLEVHHCITLLELRINSSAQGVRNVIVVTQEGLCEISASERCVAEVAPALMDLPFLHLLTKSSESAV
jgi:hypothetical protein